MREIEEYLRDEKPPTLGAVAADRLDDMRNLAIGKLAQISKAPVPMASPSSFPIIEARSW